MCWIVLTLCAVWALFHLWAIEEGRQMSASHAAFGPNYKGHKWVRTVTDSGPAMQCLKCTTIWSPDMHAGAIRWCPK